LHEHNYFLKLSACIGYYINVDRTIKVKLNLSDSDVETLKETQRVASEVFNDHVAWAFENKTWSKNKAHKQLYRIERVKFPQLPSAMVQTIRDTALEAVKVVKFKFQPRKSVSSGIRYDKRLFRLRGQQLTLSSVKGRIKTLVSFPEWCKDVTESGTLRALQLTWNKSSKQFYANFVFRLEDRSLKMEGGIIGLDRGLINIVTTSEGMIYDARLVRKNQRKHLFLRRKLSTKCTRSAKRLLKKLSGKEKRFSREQNHVLSKKLAAASGVQTYVIEDLKGIRNKRRGKHLNKLLSSWSFFQLETFLTYKCAAQGISVVKVDARYTSQRCSCCGEIRKENRSGGKYSCSKCGFKCHADINAAINIRDRWVSQSSQRLNVEQGAVKHPNGDGTSQAPRFRPCAGTI